MNTEQLTYQVALTLISGVGAITAKNLISYCGGVEQVFSASKKQLLRIPGIGPKTIQRILGQKQVLTQAKKEVEFIQKNKIQPIFYLSEAYPRRLKNCSDSPILLYYLGNADLNATKMISIVGTRHATSYGKELCQQLVTDLAAYGVTIVSGLAYGIDYYAHQACVKNEMPTIGIMAHGLDRVYPEEHRPLAKKMIKNGGLLTEFRSETEPERENFPKRNRIIAGMTDATIVVETAKKGGSMITAHLASAYNRDVFAFPGKVKASYSAGCHQLIKKNLAHLIESSEDLIYHMGWDEELLSTQKTKSKAYQANLFVDLEPVQQQIVDTLRQKNDLSIDTICRQTNLLNGEVAATLLQLEMQGMITTIPGSRYRLTVNR